MAEPLSWDDTIADVRTPSYAFVDPLMAPMESIAPEWSHQTVAKRILLNYPPGIGVGCRSPADQSKDRAPEVDLSWVDDFYDVRLLAGNRLLVSAEKCTGKTAVDVLVSFLLQLPDP
jgi:hypothetical protein